MEIKQDDIKVRLSLYFGGLHGNQNNSFVDLLREDILQDICIYIYTNYIVCQNVYSIMFVIIYNNIIQKSQSEMKVQNEEIERKQDEMKVRQDFSVANGFA
jgi:hypothetical protein